MSAFALLSGSAPGFADTLSACFDNSVEPAERVAACSDALSRNDLKKCERAAAFRERGLALMELGDYEKALASLEKATWLAREDEVAWKARAEAALALGDLEDARVIYGQFLLFHPDNLDARQGCADVMAALKQEDRSGRVDCANTATSSPIPVQALGTPEEIVEQAVNLGYCLAVELRPASRIPYCTEVIHNDPIGFSARAYRGRARAYVERDDFESSIADLTAALAFGPNSEETLVARGQLYVDLGQFERALADFQRALTYHPFNASAREGCVHVLKAMGEAGGNEGLLDECFARSGVDRDLAARFDGEALTFLQRASDAMELGDDFTAAANLALAQQRDPEVIVCLFLQNHGDAFILRDYDANARPWAYAESSVPRTMYELEAALWRQPNDAEALRERGLLYAAAGAWDRAIDDFEAAMRSDGDLAHLLVLNAAARWSMSEAPIWELLRYAEAYHAYFDANTMLSYLDQASALGIDDPLLHLMRGHVLSLDENSASEEQRLVAVERAIDALPDLDTAGIATLMVAQDAYLERSQALMRLGMEDEFLTEMNRFGEMASRIVEHLRDGCPNYQL